MKATNYDTLKRKDCAEIESGLKWITDINMTGHENYPFVARLPTVNFQ